MLHVKDHEKKSKERFCRKTQHSAAASTECGVTCAHRPTMQGVDGSKIPAAMTRLATSYVDPLFCIRLGS